MNTKLLVILTMLSLSFGCQQNHSSSTQQPPTVKTSGQQEKHEVLPNGVVIEIYKVSELRNDRSNYSAFKQNLNVYETKITIPESVFTSDLEISRTLNASSLNPSYEIISKSDAQLVDNTYVVLDRVSFRGSDYIPKTVTYKVYTNETMNGESSATLIPDLIIEKNAEAVTLQSLGISSGKYEFGVIVFENNSILRTEGGSVFFKAQRMFAENAAVESFSKEFSLTPAPIGQSGKNGGRFNLQAAYAWGDLVINMRGTAGGQGFPAKEQTDVGAAGAKGANGRLVKTFCEPVGHQVISAKADLFSSSEVKPEALVCDWECVAPGSGGDGSSGPAGFEGGVGMLGGMSGSAEVSINQKLEKFEIQVFATSGVGGLGGDGSQGGAGGAGGPPGDAAKGCDAAGSVGRVGAPGPRGAQGKNGDDGRTEKSSIIINGEKVL